MNTRARGISLLMALAVASVVNAQTPPAPPKPASDVPKVDFSQVDKDVNGRLSKQETLSIADLEAEFATLDADHDGWISPTEFSHWSRAGKATIAARDPTTAPSGSAGAQHMPVSNN